MERGEHNLAYTGHAIEMRCDYMGFKTSKVL
jgi:hypothetical protein